MKQIKIIFIVMVFLVSTALLFGTNVRSTKAAAPLAWNAWSELDRFDGAWIPPWACLKAGSYLNGCVFVSSSSARYSRLYTGRDGTSENPWSALERTFTITPFQSGKVFSCVAKVSVRRPDGGTYPINGQIGVIDPDTWTYIKIKAFTLTSTFTTKEAAAWSPLHKNVVVRVTLLGAGTPQYISTMMDLDDVGVTCIWI